MSYTYIKLDDNDSDDETVIMDENAWTLLKADRTFEEYVNCYE